MGHFMQWANDTSSLREITQEGNPAVCTPWVPIHLGYNRSAGAASLCLSAFDNQFSSTGWAVPQSVRYITFRLQANYLSATSHTGRKSCRVKSLHIYETFLLWRVHLGASKLCRQRSSLVNGKQLGDRVRETERGGLCRPFETEVNRDSGSTYGRVSFLGYVPP